MLCLYASLLYSSRRLKKRSLTKRAERITEKKLSMSMTNCINNLRRSQLLSNNINYLQDSLPFRIPELFLRRFDLGWFNVGFLLVVLSWCLRLGNFYFQPFSLSPSYTCVKSTRQNDQVLGTGRRALLPSWKSDLARNFPTATGSRRSKEVRWAKKRVSSATLKLEYRERRKWVFGTDGAFRYSWSNELDTQEN